MSLMNDCRPCLFDPANESERREAYSLTQDPGNRVIDTLETQVNELVKSRAAGKILPPENLQAGRAKVIGNVPMESYGRWVYFPWSKHIVRILPPEEFFELRTDRNQLRITRAEQEKLRKTTVGIVGLSVGMVIATTMALEGVGGTFRLADFDELSLSNLNRLLGSVAELGVNKSVIAARRIYELNPYATVELFEKGITEENAAEFLGTGNKKIGVLLEECDDLYMKVRLRELARAAQIPVIMATSERGLLDVERFDLEPNRPLFHGTLGNTTAAELQGLTAKQKVPFAIKILGVANMSDRTAASLIEIRQTISTWPQLASSVVMGAAVATDTAHKILLGRDVPSSRSTTESAIQNVVVSELPQSSENAIRAGGNEPPRGNGKTASREEARYLAMLGHQAPSAGNKQPWRFHFTGTSLEIRLDLERARNATDYLMRAAYTGIGAVLENISLGAAALGFHEAPVVVCDDDLAAWIPLGHRGEPKRNALLDVIGARATNRKTPHLEPTEYASVERLLQSVPADCAALVSDHHSFASAVGQSLRVRMLSPSLHPELFDEVRFTAEEALRTADGIDLRSLELAESDHAAFNVCRRQGVMKELAAMNLGRGLGDMMADSVVPTCAFVVPRAPGKSSASYVHAGRNMQRIWLGATAAGFSVYPFGFVSYLAARAEHETCGDLEAGLREDARLVREFYRKAIPLLGYSETPVLRLGKAGPPTVRSFRRPLQLHFTSA